VIAFIRDCYSVHCSAPITQVAALGIELHLVPLGATGLPQPLNRPAFSVVKASATKAFHDECMKDARMVRMTRDAVDNSVAVWDCTPAVLLCSNTSFVDNRSKHGSLSPIL
jgi:hypothetical protein